MTRLEPEKTTSMFVPSELICRSTSRDAPEPMATSMMTDATPMTMPSVVNIERSMLVRSAESATRKLSQRLIRRPPL